MANLPDGSSSTRDSAPQLCVVVASCVGPASSFPWVEFVDNRDDVGAQEYGSFSREHHDILRATGLRRAKGGVIALLEDHGHPAPDWCTRMLEAHQGSYAAVGGAVENGIDRPLNWAVYFCDFGRYQNPLPAGPAEFLSDCNTGYTREALASVKDSWINAFHETSVNWALRARGERLLLDPSLVLYQFRQNLSLFPCLGERYVWGRSFAGTRASETTSLRRAVLASLSFLLPVVLSSRVLSQGLRKRRHLSRSLLAAPLILVFETVWSFGEFVGYVTGRPAGSRRNK